MPRSSEERWKEIESLRKSNDAMDARLAAIRKKNDEDREELKKWEESIKEVPVELRMAAARAAERPKKYAFDEFKAYLKSVFTWQNLAHITPYLLYGIYLMLWRETNGAPEEAAAPPTMYEQYTPILTPCANESVVDAAFAKAEADGKLPKKSP